MAKHRVVVEPLTPRHWAALETLFGAKGACAGCWCMFWRLEVGERFDDIKGATAKRRFKALVSKGRASGFLAFVDAEPVGWLSVGPRTEFAKLDRAPSLRCSDAQDVVSLPCFFIKSGFRGQGVATALLNRAVLELKKAGAAVLEGYPVKAPASGGPIPPAFAYTGTVPLFEKAGFTVAQSKPTGKQRMRLVLSK